MEHLIRNYVIRGFEQFSPTLLCRPQLHQRANCPEKRPQMHKQDRPMHVTTHINPTPAYAMVMTEAVQNNNEGLALKESGQYEAAEKKYLKALDLKLKHIGENAITTALSHNALGELYIAMNRLDEAENHLQLAVKIRNAGGPTFDAATSRENLAIIYEMRGDLVAAKKMRKSTGKFACGNYDVRRTLPTFSRLPTVVHSAPGKFSTRVSSNTVESALYASLSFYTDHQSANMTSRPSITVVRNAR